MNLDKVDLATTVDFSEGYEVDPADCQYAELVAEVRKRMDEVALCLENILTLKAERDDLAQQLLQATIDRDKAVDAGVDLAQQVRRLETEATLLKVAALSGVSLDAKLEEAEQQVDEYKLLWLEMTQAGMDLLSALEGLKDAGVLNDAPYDGEMETLAKEKAKQALDEKSRMGVRLEAEILRLEQQVAGLRELHKEWLNTPFFETQEDWLEWVEEYRPRVEQALAQTATTESE
jgi:hypothetical protein